MPVENLTIKVEKEEDIIERPVEPVENVKVVDSVTIKVEKEEDGQRPIEMVEVDDSLTIKLGVPKKRPERPGASRASTEVKRWSLFCYHEWWHVDAFWLKPKSVHCTSKPKSVHCTPKRKPLYQYSVMAV